ncbi:MAG: hypothetical protein OEZ34_10135 [Spirochaetia bacterium]|nr:hypothetical protein [Spirochaetia bacterium]
MTRNKKKFSAAVLVLLISIPTIIEGSSVLFGISRPDQIILPWLVLYNVAAAAVSLIVIYFLFRNSKTAIPFSLFVTASHLTVLGILLFIFFSSGNVALKSIAAMSLRSTIWLIVFLISKNTEYES